MHYESTHLVDAWGAAVERPLLEALQTACTQARLTLKTVIPTASVLGWTLATPVPVLTSRLRQVAKRPATGATTIVVVDLAWSDGASTYALRYSGQKLVKTRRLGNSSAPDALAGLPDQLARALGPGNHCYAGAYAAATHGHREPIVWRIVPEKSLPGLNRRMRTAAACFLTGTIMAFASTPVAATFAALRATHHLRAIARERTRALEITDSLHTVTSALQDVAAFSRQRHVVIPLLAALTAMLPAQTALTAFHIDSGGGTLTAVTPTSSDLVGGLGRVPAIVGPELIGPVTLETAPPSHNALPPQTGGPARALNRVTIRFQLAPEAWALASSPTSASHSGAR